MVDVSAIFTEQIKKISSALNETVSKLKDAVVKNDRLKAENDRLKQERDQARDEIVKLKKEQKEQIQETEEFCYILIGGSGGSRVTPIGKIFAFTLHSVFS